MKRPSIILPVFIVLSLLQWYVPFSIMRDSLEIVEKGRELKFKIDWASFSDPLNERYLQLQFQVNDIHQKMDTTWKPFQKVYVLLSEDSSGMVSIDSIQEHPPQSSTVYVSAHIQYWLNKEELSYRVRYPFQRYYLQVPYDEETGRKFREIAKDSTTSAYALVNVLDGKGVVQNVYINDKPVSEVIDQIAVDQQE